MADETRSPGFWQTIPGMLTALAGIITAVAGLLLALYQTGFIGSAKSPTANANPPSAISTPDTTARPSQSSEVPTPEVDLSGMWRDDEGTVYEVWRDGQDGRHFRFTSSLRDFRSEGTMTLNGREITSSFTTNYNFTGKGWGTLSPDGKEIRGGFRESTGKVHSGGRMYRD